MYFDPNKGFALTLFGEIEPEKRPVHENAHMAGFLFKEKTAKSCFRTREEAYIG